MKPRYKHDSDCCTFLGYYKEYDLYFCPQNGIRTVIARYGNHGCDYTSGWFKTDSMDHPLYHAKQIAIHREITPAEEDTLDLYDSLLIRAIRCRANPSLGFLKRVWAKRCAIEVKYVEKEYIIFHLLELIGKMKLISIQDFACKLDPEQSKYYRNYDKDVKGFEYRNTLLNVCCSIIRTCSVEKLYGFRCPSKFIRK